MKKFIAFVFFLAFFVNAPAQTGCLVPDNKIYIDKVNPGLIGGLLLALLGGQPLYHANNYEELSGAECSWIPQSTGGGCKICPNDNFNFLGNCNTGLLSGYEGTFIMQCPLDDYLPILLITGSLFGYYLIRYKNEGNFFE